MKQETLLKQKGFAIVDTKYCNVITTTIDGAFNIFNSRNGWDEPYPEIQELSPKKAKQ